MAWAFRSGVESICKDMAPEWRGRVCDDRWRFLPAWIRASEEVPLSRVAKGVLDIFRGLRRNDGKRGKLPRLGRLVDQLAKIPEIAQMPCGFNHI